MQAPNNQCLGCNLFTTAASGYCDKCAAAGRGPRPVGFGPSEDAVIVRGPTPSGGGSSGSAMPGLRPIRSSQEMAREDHPNRYLVSGDARIRFAGCDPDLFDRIGNLCRALSLIASEIQAEAKAARFVTAPSGETAIVPKMGDTEPDRRRNLVELMRLIATDMKKFAAKDEETWQLIRRLREGASGLETWLDLGGDARGEVLRLRSLASDLETHVDRRKGF